MKTINTYIFEKLKISPTSDIDFDRFKEEFRIYARNNQNYLKLSEFKLNKEYHSAELYILDALTYDEHNKEIYIRAYNKYNKHAIVQLKLRDISDWIRYFILDMNLSERKNEEMAIKQIKEITLYLQSKDPESMMSDYDPEFM